MENINDYILKAVNATLLAGRDIMDIYLTDDEEFTVETKKDSSPLTVADKAAHTVILSALEPIGIPVLSEEGAEISYDERRQWDRLWIVDPLDGTKEFIRRNGEFTVNIALVEDGRPVLGVVYAPAAGTLYFGSRSTGSCRCDVNTDFSLFRSFGRLVESSVKLPLPTNWNVYTVVASKSHRNPETDEFIAARKEEHGKIDIVSRGSSLKICMVAEGSADIYPRFGPTMEWDTAAGHAVAVFAGARVCDPTGKELVYNKPELLNPYFIVERS